MDATQKNQLYKELEELFTKDSKLTKIIAGIGAMILGPLALYYFITEPRDYFNNFVLLFGFIGSVIWLYSGFKKGNIHANAAYQEIRKDNGNLVWIFPEDTNDHGAASYSVVFMNRNGKEFRVPTAKYAVRDEILDKLALLYPDALLGYTDENKRLVQQLISK